jgi:hypothetical protein
MVLVMMTQMMDDDGVHDGIDDDDDDDDGIVVMMVIMVVVVLVVWCDEIVMKSMRKAVPYVATLYTWFSSSHCTCRNQTILLKYGAAVLSSKNFLIALSCTI